MTAVARLGLASIVVLSAAWSLGACSTRPSLGAACQSSAQCSTGLVCAYERCRTPCASAGDCPFGMRCLGPAYAGACSLSREDTCLLSPCPGALVCRENQCRTLCSANADCPSGECAFEALTGTCIEPRSGADAGLLDGGGTVAPLQSMDLSSDPTGSVVVSPAPITLGSTLALFVLVGSATATVASVTDDAGDAWVRAPGAQPTASPRLELWLATASGSAHQITITTTEPVEIGLSFTEWSAATTTRVVTVHAERADQPGTSISSGEIMLPGSALVLAGCASVSPSSPASLASGPLVAVSESRFFDNTGRLAYSLSVAYARLPRDARVEALWRASPSNTSATSIVALMPPF